MDTPYVVEPNIKEGRGGLRDLHTARWIAQVAFNLTSDHVWDGLRAGGVLLDGEIEAVSEAVEFIARTRNNLHLLTGRGREVLSAPRHAQIAMRMGFGDRGEESAREFHLNLLRPLARTLAHLPQDRGSLPGPGGEIEPGVVARPATCIFSIRARLLGDSGVLIRLFRHAQSHGLQIHREADDLIAAAASGYKLTPSACRSFVDILAGPGAAQSLRAMAELACSRR